jgi:hypothetical protein
MALPMPYDSTPNQRGLVTLAERNPIVSFDSFFGREHATYYGYAINDGNGTRAEVISGIFTIILGPTRVVYKSPGRGKQKQKTWEDVSYAAIFPDVMIDIRRREEAGLPYLPGTLRSNSYSLDSDENTLAIRFSSLCFLARQPAFLREIHGVGPKKIEILEKVVACATQGFMNT